MNLIGATATASSAPIEAALDTTEYPTGIKIPNKQMKELETTGTLVRHNWHSEWNYTLNPRHTH